MNVKEIGKAVGYADSNYFAKGFQTDYRPEPHGIPYGYFPKNIKNVLRRRLYEVHKERQNIG